MKHIQTFEDFSISESEDLNEKRIVSAYNIKNAVIGLGLVNFDMELFAEIGNAIATAVEPILAKKGYSVESGNLKF
jgi:hypothetical protein